MRQMLADPKVLKFGVGITFDAEKFWKDHRLQIRGCVDLRHLVVRIRNNGLTRRGLKNIASVWLGIVYESGKDVQCSVWDTGESRASFRCRNECEENDLSAFSDVLSPVQVEYAALDGLVAVFAVAEFLYRRHKLPNPSSTPQMQADLENLTSSAIRPLCQGVIDVRFKARLHDQNPKYVLLAK